MRDNHACLHPERHRSRIRPHSPVESRRPWFGARRTANCSAASNGCSAGTSSRRFAASTNAAWRSISTSAAWRVSSRCGSCIGRQWRAETALPQSRSWGQACQPGLPKIVSWPGWKAWPHLLRQSQPSPVRGRCGGVHQPAAHAAWLARVSRHRGGRGACSLCRGKSG
jgi:hypothetical protein